VLCAVDGRVVLRRRPMGAGAVWLAGWDHGEDSIDGPLSPFETREISRHSLCRFAGFLGISAPRIRSGQAYLYKEWVRNAQGEFLLLFSHYAQERVVDVEVRLDRAADGMLDLATGERFALEEVREGWQRVAVLCRPGAGRYLAAFSG
jgi:hypothetical protein